MDFKLLRHDWKILQKEARTQMERAPVLNRKRSKELDESLSLDEYGWVRGWTDDENWLNYGLIYNYEYCLTNCEQCPESFEILQKIVDLKKIFMMGFSLLKKGGEIPTHVDENNSCSLEQYDIFHLTLSSASEGCELQVMHHIMPHREGQLLRFQDIFPHSARNKSNQDRIILYVKIKKDS